MGTNLEIGSGENPQPGYVHCDKYVSNGKSHLLDFICDACSVPLADGSCSNILMFGVFEHFGIFEVEPIMAEVLRLLEPGGVFKFDVPDFDWFVERYLFPDRRPENRDEDWILKAIFGGQDGEGQFHKWGWNYKRMMNFLQSEKWNFSEIKMVGRQWRNEEFNHLIWECKK